MIKKRVLLLTFILIYTLFLGCSLDKVPTGDETLETESFLPDKTMIEEYVKLTFILEGNVSYYFKTETFDGVTTAPPLDKLNEKLLRELNTEIEFQWIFQGADQYYQNEIMKLYNAGVPFDAFAFHKIEPFVGENIAMDITEYIKNNVKYLYRYFTYDEMINSPYISVDQRVYSIPTVFDSTAYRYGSYSLLLPAKDKRFFSDPVFINKDELSNYLTRIINQEAEASGLRSSLSYVEFCLKNRSPVFHQFSRLFLLDKDLNVTWLCDLPEFEDILQTYVTEAYRNRGNDGQETYAEIQNYKQLHEPTYRRPHNENMIVGKNYEFDYVFLEDGHVPIKKFPGYSSLFYEANTDDEESIYGSTKGDMLILSNKCKHPERVLLFLDWLYSDKENYEMLRYGIQNVHYYKDGRDSVYFDLSNKVIYNWSGSAFFVDPLLDSYNVPGYSEYDGLSNRKFTSFQRQVLSGEKALEVPSDEEVLKFLAVINTYASAYYQLFEKIVPTGNVRHSLDEYKALFSENDRTAIEDFIKKYDVYFLENYGISFQEEW